MRPEWKEVRLEECVSVLGDGLHGTPQYSDKGEYYFINGNNLKDNQIIIKNGTKRVGKDEYEKYKKPLNNRTLLVSINGTLGNIGSYNNEKVILGKSACYFNVLDSISKDYIRYVLMDKHFQDYIVQYATGTTIKNASLKQMRDYTFQLPPLPEQQAIAATLSCLDEKIELNNKINANLEAQAQAIFKSWFVDFEPFGGKRPSTWTNGKAEGFFDIAIGKTPPRKEPEWFTTNPQDVIWVSISDMGRCGMFISDSSEYLTSKSISRFNIKIVPSGSVLLSFKLTVGRVTITDGEMATNEAIAHFKQSSNVTCEYLYCYLKAFDYQSLGNTSSIATAVNSKTIKAMPFIMPDSKTLSDFHTIVSPLFENVRANLKENACLAALRDNLLPKLMSGEIEVPIN